MNFYLYISFNLTIIFAGVLAAVRFKNVSAVYYPFFVCLWIGCLNELLSALLAWNHQPTLVNNNIYVLLEALLITGFFNRLGVFPRKWIYPVLGGLLFAVWVIENFVVRTISQNSTWFRIVYAYFIVVLSINVINQIIFSTRKVIFRDATFLLCASFAFYFTYKALIQTFVLYGVNQSSGFIRNLYVIMIYINLAINLLYTLAVLWMPGKVKFIPSLSLRAL